MTKSSNIFHFAEILLPINLDGSFTYSVPENFRDNIEIGNRVLVNFGKNKLYTGIVYSLHNNIPNFETKDIINILEDEVFIKKEQFQFIKWISDYYCCSLGDALNATLPDILIPSSKSKIFYNSDFDEAVKLNDNETTICSFIATKKETTIDEIINNCKIKNPINILKKLESLNIISISQKITKEYKERRKKIVFFDKNIIAEQISEFENIAKKRGKQFQILEVLIKNCEDINSDSCCVNLNKILSECETTHESIKSLAKKNFLKIEEVPESRLEDYSEKKDFDKTVILSPHQQIAYEKITSSFSEKKPVLLHGVTSSGKTEIYIKLIKDCLANNKTVLYLLPEIVLTSQIINRLEKYFGNDIAVFHSKYPMTSRAEVYLELLKLNKKIIIGVRSAIFLPFNNLGLIIVDEEHENTYKQTDSSPRYNARDAAVYLAQIHNANVILGSATPSLESYQNTIIGKYSIVELKERYGNVKLPEIIIADTAEGYHRKLMTSHFHPTLLMHIKEALDNKEQIILFQNRRGFSQYIECKKCGWVYSCDNCNVSLTYHKFNNKMHCHYCGEKFDIIHKCKKCNSDLSFCGMGTEKVEEELIKIFPTARMKRLDYDSAKTRAAYEKIISDFEDHNIDILIGTQMLSKGLDFENVSLVGVINADNLINRPDFRAFERAFQLLMQVSGRAGRREKQGRVIIQTFNKNNPVIQHLLENDYEGFFKKENDNRKLLNYPPFSRFIEIKLRSKDKNFLLGKTIELAKELRKIFIDRLKGPSEPLINKINNYHFLRIHLRLGKNDNIKEAKKIIKENCKAVLKDSKDLRIDIDVDVM